MAKTKKSEETEGLEAILVKVAPTPGDPVLETRNCVECQGDGKWDGVECEVCRGSGKIFKDGTVVGHGSGTFVAKGGVLLPQ